MWKNLFLGCLLVQCALANKYRRTNSDEAIAPAGVIWDSPTNSAFYVDYGVDSSAKKCLFRYDAGEDRTYSAYVEGRSLGSPSYIVPIKTDGSLKKFVVGFETFAGVVHWDGSSDSAQLVEELFSVEDRLGPRERYGFGHRDHNGRSLYSGTVSLDACGPSANQSVYVGSSSGLQNFKRVLTDLRYPIGFGFVNGYVYILDACTLKLYEIPNSPCKGTCGEARVVFSFKDIGKKPGHFIPSGMDSDDNGILYTASYYDGQIWAIDPIEGRARVVAELPTGGLTSVRFAGTGQDFYVTVSKRIIDFSDGHEKHRQHPGTAMYQIRGLGSSINFKRLRI